MGPAFISLFFFLPLGIVAIIFAAQYRSKLQAGDYGGAASAAGLAQLNGVYRRLHLPHRNPVLCPLVALLSNRSTHQRTSRDPALI
jgi:hypothetical protein